MLDYYLVTKWVYTKQKTMFSSAVGHSGAHWSKLRTTSGFSRTYNCNKIYYFYSHVWANFVGPILYSLQV
jgi:hypothetical protein